MGKRHSIFLKVKKGEQKRKMGQTKFLNHNYAKRDFKIR